MNRVRCETTQGAFEPVVNVEHLREMGFTVKSMVHNGYVEFWIYNIVGERESTTGGLAWDRKGDSTGMNPAENLEDAQVFLSGSVKWDNCSNWSFDMMESGLMHSCDRRGLQRVGDVMAYCWDYASKHCPGWDM